MPTDRKARFVVLEGLDGAGTSTQAELLARALEPSDQAVCLTAEPSDGPLGGVLRAHVRGEISLDPTTTALTFAADRADHLARVVRPALARGEWVVCDRYLLSTLAYQGVEGVDRGFILKTAEGVDPPDLTVFLDVPPQVAAERIAQRRRPDRYDDRGAELRDAYRTSIDLLRGAGHRIEVVDGTPSPQAVLEGIRARLDFPL